ncbi:MAG: hypothetical protein KJ072_21005 [Verrucomicrobia bacterium]|nr:hypothetical protein [Verrucomicrobiota bacterium]
MSKRAPKRSAKDDAMISRLFGLLNSHVKADPYGWDGALAEEIQRLPVGLRAMAATHHLDISLTLDDIGWHFLNFGHPSHVEETERGLRELGLAEVAAMLHEAYELVRPHLRVIMRPGGDYYGVMERLGHMKRLNELTKQARAALGDNGIYRHWAAYAREHPDRVFGSESASEPKCAPAGQRVTRKARGGGR